MQSLKITLLKLKLKILYLFFKNSNLFHVCHWRDMYAAIFIIFFYSLTSRFNKFLLELVNSSFSIQHLSSFRSSIIADILKKY
jgi:hypothetical protein